MPQDRWETLLKVYTHQIMSQTSEPILKVSELNYLIQILGRIKMLKTKLEYEWTNIYRTLISKDLDQC